MSAHTHRHLTSSDATQPANLADCRALKCTSRRHSARLSHRSRLLLTMAATAGLMVSSGAVAASTPAAQPAPAVLPMSVNQSASAIYSTPARPVVSASSDQTLTRGLTSTQLGAPASYVNPNVLPHDLVTADSPDGPPGQIAQRFDQELAANFPVRLPFTERERAAAEWIAEQLSEMGFSEHEAIVQGFDRSGLSDAQEFALSRLTSGNENQQTNISQNVVVRLGGAAGDDADVIVVSAGYDTTMPAHLPADPASGANVALLLETAQRLRSQNLPQTVYLAFFGADAAGRAGAQHFFSTLPYAEQHRISLVINVDQIGAADTLLFTAAICDGGERCEEQSAQFAQSVTGLADTLNSEVALFKEEDFGLGDAPTCACCVFGVPESVVGVAVVNFFAFDFAADLATELPANSAVAFNTEVATAENARVTAQTSRALAQYQTLLTALISAPR